MLVTSAWFLNTHRTLLKINFCETSAVQCWGGGGILSMKERITGNVSQMTPKGHQWLSLNPTIYETCQLNKHADLCNTFLLEKLTFLLAQKLLAFYVTIHFFTAFQKAGHCFISCATWMQRRIFTLRLTALPSNFPTTIFWLFLVSHICVLYATHFFPINAVTHTVHCEYCLTNISYKKKRPYNAVLFAHFMLSVIQRLTWLVG
jgi:hypothetical protein